MKKIEMTYEQLGDLIEKFKYDLESDCLAIANAALASLIILCSGCLPDTVLSILNRDVDLDQGVIAMYDAISGVNSYWSFGNSDLMRHELEWRIGITDDDDGLFICTRQLLDKYIAACIGLDVTADVIWHMHNALVEQGKIDEAEHNCNCVSASNANGCVRFI